MPILYQSCCIRVRLQLFGRFAFLGRVRALVEAGEEEVEHERVGSDEISKGNRVVAFIFEEQLEGVDHDEHKLDL